MLYIVGTPIGNLGDIGLRALQALRDADVIVCEDSRVTKKLLFHYEITQKQMISYDEFSHNQNYPKIIDALLANKAVALVSDAGMPCISDPGSYLVRCIRDQYTDIAVQSIPGPTALTTALAVSGVDTTSGFLFLGFPPHKKGRETFFTSLQKKSEICNVICFYESSHRILDALERLDFVHCTICLCRELTKAFEQVLTGSASELKQSLEQHVEQQKGEFVVILRF